VTRTSGGNLGGCTSALLSAQPELARRLRLDTLWPVAGLKRETGPSYELLVPAAWVRDLTLARNQALQAELDRSLPSLSRGGRRLAPNAAFGPAGGSGAENLSIVSSTAAGALTELGTASEVAARFLAGIEQRSRGDKTATLLRVDESGESAFVFDYEISSARGGWKRRLSSLLCSSGGLLYTVTAMAPAAASAELHKMLRECVRSFRVVSS